MLLVSILTSAKTIQSHLTHLNQLKSCEETMKRAYGFKYQHCYPELKKTTS